MPVHDPEPDDDDDLVCYCMRVDRGTIRAAIAAGAASVEDLQERTHACLGCGTCRLELLEMLRHAGVLLEP